MKSSSPIMLGGNVHLNQVRYRVAAAIGILTLGLPLIAQSPATAEDIPIDPPVIWIGNGLEFSAADGQPISISSDIDGEGERTIRGLFPDDHPVVITVLSAPEVLEVSLPQPDVIDWDELAAAQFEGEETKTYKAEDIPVDPATMSERFAVAATAQSISIAWAAVADATAYTVSRNGGSTTTVALPEFVEADLLPAEQQEYGIEALSASGEVLSTLFVPVQTLPVGGNLNSFSPMTFQEVSTSFNYRTFIPDARADGGLCVPVDHSAATTDRSDHRTASTIGR